VTDSYCTRFSTVAGDSDCAQIGETGSWNGLDYPPQKAMPLATEGEYADDKPRAFDQFM